MKFLIEVIAVTWRERGSRGFMGYSPLYLSGDETG